MSVPSRTFLDSVAGPGLWDGVDKALAAGSQVWISSQLLNRITEALGEQYGDRRWLVLRVRNEDDRLRRCVIRIRDIVVSLIALVLLSPLLLLVALLVKLTSPGPVFYSCEVVGLHGQRFRWLKFRSMRVEAGSAARVEERRERFRSFVQGGHSAAAAAAPQKVIDHKQVTAVGRAIRAFSIDELPQLWHVLRGQMSLVGPRPCLPYEEEYFTGWRSRRFNVVPGLTGLWQVFGRGVAGFEEGAAMDVYYCYARSLGLDFWLMWRTISVVLHAQGGL